MTYHNYHDLCVEILYRLQEDRNIDKDSVINEFNYNVSIYLKLIPSLLNEALLLLATSGKYINRSYDVFIQPCKNISTEKFDFQHTYSTYNINLSENINSTYFEVMGSCLITFESNGELIESYDYPGCKTETLYNTNDQISNFKVIKEIKENEKTIKIDNINLKSSFGTFKIKTLALYKETFNNVDSVYEYNAFKKIDLKEKLPDFYKLNDSNIFVESKYNLITYKNTRNYSWEDPYNLIIDNTREAIWRINYFSYPTNLKPLGASDITTTIEVAPEVYPLILLYIEGKIRFIREMDFALGILNEFEQKRAELLNNQVLKVGVNTYFEDVKGWL